MEPDPSQAFMLLVGDEDRSPTSTIMAVEATVVQEGSTTISTPPKQKLKRNRLILCVKIYDTSELT